MKRIALILTLALCIAFCGEVCAQRYLPGMRGIQVTGGFVDGIHKHGAKGYCFGAGIATYAKNANRWVLGAEYLSKEYAYKDIYIPKTQFTAEGGYYLMFLSDPSKTFFLSLGGSALAGYETSNWGDKLLFDGATIRNKDTFIYGGAITLELESYITDRIVFLINARERVLWGSTIGKFHVQFGAGLKFIIK